MADKDIERNKNIFKYRSVQASGESVLLMKDGKSVGGGKKVVFDPWLFIASVLTDLL